MPVFPGKSPKQGLKRLPNVLDEHHPQLMILCHGGNDLLRKMRHERHGGEYTWHDSVIFR